MTSLLTVSELSVNYGTLTALDRVSFRVEPGTIVALVGPNGAGKTTLFRAVFAELPKVKGNVRIGELNPFNLRDRRRIWSVARWVPDTPVLYDELTVSEQLTFSARCYGVPEAMLEAITRDIEMNFGLSEVSGRLIKELSFGTARKVQLATGFFSGSHGPKLILFDEPTVGLDPHSRQLFLQFLKQYVRPNEHASERSVVISSHNLSELSGIADSVIMLGKGGVIASGKISDITASMAQDLSYQLVLCELRAAELATLLQSHLSLLCQVTDPRTLSIQCSDEALAQDVLRLALQHQPPFLIREFREELSALERAFLHNTEAMAAE